MPSDKTFPFIGLFYGEGGGPGGVSTSSVPSTDAHKMCSFLDENNQFCSLDGELCPFVGFNYRRCRKYIVNISRGNIPDPVKATTSSGPPRVESLREEVLQDLENFQLAETAAIDDPEELIVHLLGAVSADLGHDVNTLAGMPPSQAVADINRRMQRGLILVYNDYGLDPDIVKRLKKTKQLKDMVAAYLNHYITVDISGANRRKVLDDVAAHFVDSIHAKGGGEVNPKDVTILGQKLNLVSDYNPDGVQDKPQQTTDLSTELASNAGKVASATPEKEGDKNKKKKSKNNKEKNTRVRLQQTAHTTVSARKVRPRVRKRATFGSARSGFPSTERKMTPEQFKNWFNANYALIPDHVKDNLFSDPMYKDKKVIFDLVDKYGTTGNHAEIKGLQKVIDKQFADYRRTQTRYADTLAQWDENVRLAKRLGQITDADLKFLRTDPQQLDRTAKKMNSVVNKLIRYDLVMKTMPGGAKVPTFVQKSLLPKFERSDFEVMRMSEQMGLRAIQKQHQFGKDYGRYNARNLLLQQVITPFVLTYFGLPSLIQPIMRMWPQGWIDARFFAKRDELPKLSKDDKYLMSLKFASSRQKRLMKGFDTDAPLRPDQAVLHTRSYPTTKTPWSRMRSSVLKKQHKQRNVGFGSSADGWRRSYMPR